MPTNDFLYYLATYQNGHADPDRIPPLNQVSEEMGVSLPKLREQLEGARTLGLVEVKPKTGIRRKPYQFALPVTESLLYAVTRDRQHFSAFSDLRVKLETVYWCEAVGRLDAADHAALQDLLAAALDKLTGDPIIIPHAEHRQLHLTIFSKIGNPFVIGLLEAYWNAYEAVELNTFADLAYLREVWDYHRVIVEAIIAGDAAGSLRAFEEHTQLLRNRSS
jgi:DNA-binding FadR family transcriptional regulator